MALLPGFAGVYQKLAFKLEWRDLCRQFDLFSAWLRLQLVWMLLSCGALHSGSQALHLVLLGRPDVPVGASSLAPCDMRIQHAMFCFTVNSGKRTRSHVIRMAVKFCEYISSTPPTTQPGSATLIRSSGPPPLTAFLTFISRQR